MQQHDTHEARFEAISNIGDMRGTHTSQVLFMLGTRKSGIGVCYGSDRILVLALVLGFEAGES